MSIPIEDLALAYELRCEYGMPWKRIAMIIGGDTKAIYDAVRRALIAGIHHA